MISSLQGKSLRMDVGVRHWPGACTGSKPKHDARNCMKVQDHQASSMTKEATAETKYKAVGK